MGLDEDFCEHIDTSTYYFLNIPSVLDGYPDQTLGRSK